MMDSIFSEILKRVDRLAVEIAALKITEGAGTAGGAISGSGTTGRITQWSGTSSLGDSTLIKTGVGVLTLTSDTDYTLTADTSGTIQTQEAAATTYLKLDGSNDPMTGGLSIVGGADEIQFAVTAANGQTANMLTVNDSSNNTTFWFNNGGSPFMENKNFTIIGSSVPIDAYRDAGTSTMRFSTYTDSTTNGGRISLRGAGGTFASPTDMLNNYICGEMQWFGYVNGAHRQGFVIRASMINTISSTSYPTNAYFILTLQGATTGTTVMTLHNNGYVGINTGTGAPLGMLGIVARAATDIGLSVKGASSQSANLTNWQNSSNTILALVDAVGGAVFNENGDAAGDVRMESDTEVNMFLLDANGNTDGTLYLGGSTNGIQITKGGELTLIGTATRWNDLRVEPVVRSTGAKAPSFINWINGLYLYDFDNVAAGSEKEIFFQVQMPHDWKEQSTISPHVHWTNKTGSTAGQVVRWGMEYSVATIGGTFGASTTIYGTTVVGGADITVANEHFITELTDITMTNNLISTILVCRLFRNSSDAADTYTGTAGLLYVDLHYEIDTMGGSKDEFTK